MEIGIREFKDRLSEILHRANSGEEITITLHGQPLCQIAPIQTNSHQLPPFLQEAAAAGLIIPPKFSGLKRIQALKPRKGSRSSEEVLRAGRRERIF